VLSNYGYRVIEAADGEDAVRKFEVYQDDIKLVILDGIMPNKNGKEAYDDIRKLCPNMKAIFMSGYAEDIFPSGGLTEKNAVFIQKPVTPSDLIRKVRAALDN
jgi:DNA-binding response OmpR family regulator